MPNSSSSSNIHHRTDSITVLQLIEEGDHLPTTPERTSTHVHPSSSTTFTRLGRLGNETMHAKKRVHFKLPACNTHQSSWWSRPDTFTHEHVKLDPLLLQKASYHQLPVIIAELTITMLLVLMLWIMEPKVLVVPYWPFAPWFSQFSKLVERSIKIIWMIPNNFAQHPLGLRL